MTTAARPTRGHVPLGALIGLAGRRALRWFNVSRWLHARVRFGIWFALISIAADVLVGAMLTNRASALVVTMYAVCVPFVLLSFALRRAGMFGDGLLTIFVLSPEGKFGFKEAIKKVGGIKQIVRVPTIIYPTRALPILMITFYFLLLAMISILQILLVSFGSQYSPEGVSLFLLFMFVLFVSGLMLKADVLALVFAFRQMVAIGLPVLGLIALAIMPLARRAERIWWVHKHVEPAVEYVLGENEPPAAKPPKGTYVVGPVAPATVVPTVTAVARPASNTFAFPAGADHFDTRISVVAGQLVTINSASSYSESCHEGKDTGEIADITRPIPVQGLDYRPTDLPDGGADETQAFIDPSSHYGALMAYMGTGPAVEVGSDGTFTAPATGTVALALNLRSVGRCRRNGTITGSITVQ